MWSKSLEVLDPYEAIKEENEARVKVVEIDHFKEG